MVHDDGAVSGEGTRAALLKESFIRLGSVRMLRIDLLDGQYQSHVFDARAVRDPIDNNAGHVLIIVGHDEVCCCCDD